MKIAYDKHGRPLYPEDKVRFNNDIYLVEIAAKNGSNLVTIYQHKHTLSPIQYIDVISTELEKL